MTRFDYSTLLGAEYRIDDELCVGARLRYSFVPTVKYNHPIFMNPHIFLWRGVEFYLAYDLVKY
jgi:hypothetical protein